MTKRERNTGGLLRRPNCRFWYAQYYDQHGRQIRTSTKKETKAEAQGVLRKLMDGVDRGEVPISDLKKIKYGHLRRALLDNYRERGNKSLQTLSDGSETIWGLEALDAFFEYKAEPEQLGTPLTRITVDTVRDFTRKRQEDGVGNATINRSLALLRRMLRLAYEDGKIHRMPKIRMLKEPPARKGFLQREQFEKLLAALPEHLRPLVTFLYYCGARLGEALQITWLQVDLKAALIRFEPEQTKTDEARYVPLPDVLLALLAKMEPKEGTVFASENLRKEWMKACAGVGLGTLDRTTWQYSGLIIHDLRRSAIKNLMKAGVNEKVAMEISGHKTRTVFERYHIVDSADVLSAMRRVENRESENLGASLVQSGRSRRNRKQLKA